jgi:hypothetical protein
MRSIKHIPRVVGARLLESTLPYTSYTITAREHLGTYSGSLESFVSELEAIGYHYQLFAAVKYLDDETDVGSYARIPDEHPPEADGTKLADHKPGECQYHVHAFDRGDHIECYGHYEIHPYPWTPFWDLERPWPKHYNPTYDRDSIDRSEWTYLRGVRDAKLDSILE